MHLHSEVNPLVALKGTPTSDHWGAIRKTGPTELPVVRRLFSLTVPLFSKKIEEKEKTKAFKSHILCCFGRKNEGKKLNRSTK